MQQINISHPKSDKVTISQKKISNTENIFSQEYSLLGRPTFTIKTWTIRTDWDQDIPTKTEYTDFTK